MSATCPNCEAPTPDGATQCPKCGCILALANKDDPLLGQVVGNLVLTQRLGAGGMGAVYMAEHRSLKTPYAVKVLHPQFSNNPQTAERFRREAVACSKLRHENVVFVTDFGIQENLGIYIVMEFVEGQALKSVLRQAGRLSVGRVGRIVEQVCDAMHAAHRMEIVHRDLKPDNIIVLSDESRRDFIKVLDFGIAHIATGDKEEQLTQAGLTMGTPTYMSPEQIMGSLGSIGPPADIYALGIMIFEMLTGNPPFPRRNDFELLTHHMATIPPKLGDNWTDMKGTRMEALIAAMLEKKPEKRPPTMLEVKRLLVESIQELRERGVQDAFYEGSAESVPVSAPAAPSGPVSSPGTGTSPTLHLNTLVRKIRAQAPNSAAAQLLAALPNAESLKGDAISAALWGVLQEELLDAPLDSDRFAQGLEHLGLLMQTVLSAHEGDKPTSSQEKIFRSLRNLMTLSPKDRQKRIGETLAPLMGHRLFPADSMPKGVMPGQSGKWEALKSVMTKEIKVPWTEKDKPRPPGEEKTMAPVQVTPPPIVPQPGQSGRWESIKSVMTKEIKVPWTEKDRPRPPGEAPPPPPPAAPAAPAKADEAVEIDIDMVEEADDKGEARQKGIIEKLNAPVTVSSLKSLLNHEIRLFGGKKKK